MSQNAEIRRVPVGVILVVGNPGRRGSEEDLAYQAPPSSFAWRDGGGVSTFSRPDVWSIRNQDYSFA
ncbi:hypothetical protein LshimejAT787_0605940 [Lyophyllum shimeji]|uniref:Uncharacterized protein n=1 Tax=Lyophyllum shimeji TaxID=47721 RepID=A0A9P3UNL0_LYOSH|nr:hypothetical protein LshimejAT787_0605940 [Lyophyllum shimeji]